MKILSLLCCVASGVSPGHMYGQISRYWWMCFIKRHLVRGRGWSCVDGLVAEGVLVSGVICLFESIYNVFSQVTSLYIIIGCVIGMEVDEANLVIGCL